MAIEIRKMIDDDLEPANEMLKLAFGNPVNRLDDLQLYRRLQPDGWFTAFDGSRLIGTVGEINYASVAHVGFMAVHPQMQGQGIGHALMEFLLVKLEQDQVPLITLDASSKGRPLYEKLGFVDIDETAIFERKSKTASSMPEKGIQPISFRDVDELVEVDRDVFGADRRKVFESLMEINPSRAFLHRDGEGQLSGYLFAQKNRIGPWVMFKPGHAEGLLRAALTLSYEGAVSVVVPSVNQEAVELLQRYGFERARAGRHMAKGMSEPPGERLKVYAQTSLGAG